MKLRALFCSTLALAGSAPAQAATLQFDFDSANPLWDISWQLDSNPLPSFASGIGFIVSGVPVSTSGGPVPMDIGFYTTGGLGGFEILSLGLETTGAQLFTGPTSHPVFTLGTFNLNRLNFTQLAGTLTISEVTAGVPEPATWALMLLGFAAAGGVLRRRKAVVVRTSVSYT